MSGNVEVDEVDARLEARIPTGCLPRLGCWHRLLGSDHARSVSLLACNLEVYELLRGVRSLCGCLCGVALPSYVGFVAIVDWRLCTASCTCSHWALKWMVKRVSGR